MEQDFFAKLPQEIIINMLLKCSFPTITRYKCVDKSSLSLIEGPKFIQSYVSKSFSHGGLALFQGEARPNPKPLKILEFIDEQNSAHPCKFVSKFSFSFPDRDLIIQSSVNGLLFLIKPTKSPRDLFICNPITREYIKLPPPKMASYTTELVWQINCFGFGVSKVSGQHKVVRLFREFELGFGVSDQYKVVRMFREFGFGVSRFPCKCEVYTLETGSWRSVAAGCPLSYAWDDEIGVFVNGKLHWLVRSSETSRWILCFDLETELFSTFSLPRVGGNVWYNPRMCALGDRLCLCDNSVDGIAIWLMSEYGDEQSWGKEFIIRKSIFRENAFCPIKVFKGGDILMAMEQFDKPYMEQCNELFFYSSKNKSMERICFNCSGAAVYTPSFLPLKTFAAENSSSVIKPTVDEFSRLVMKEFNSCVDTDHTKKLLCDLRDLSDKSVSNKGNSSIVRDVHKMFEHFHSSSVPSDASVLPPAPVESNGSGSRRKSRKEKAMQRTSKKPLNM